jgi:Fe-S oxidoreductase
MNIHFDPFVLPFFFGVLIWLFIFLWKIVNWIDEIPLSQRKIVWYNIFSSKFIEAIKIIFLESLIHQKIFKKNPLLGYMHMSIAFGWFLLIVFGSIESKFGQHNVFNMPWDPIFFNYFEPERSHHTLGPFFIFIMDFLLLFILSGVFLAWLKRVFTKWFGIKKNTKLFVLDKIALYSLWLIFPSRLWVESLNAANHNNGGFLTQSIGNLLAQVVDTRMLEYPSWWVYSSVLFVFFVTLPFSRYMHIVTEPFLILFRTLGAVPENEIRGYAKLEINSCSRCGICIDSCQLFHDAQITNIQGAYFIQSVRYNFPFSSQLMNCLQCGRCNIDCPVGIDIVHLKDVVRTKQHEKLPLQLSYPSVIKSNNDHAPHVIFFAGCMTRLSPSLVNSFLWLLDYAGITYDYIDRDHAMCCGRPLIQAGLTEAAQKLIAENKKIFMKHPSMVLVTTCPICLQTFKSNYHLPKHVLHHSELLHMLVKANRLPSVKLPIEIVYHDSCELAFRQHIKKEPRVVLKQIGHVVNEDENQPHWCCGGSTSNVNITYEQRMKVALAALRRLNVKEETYFSTSCPLCKKTFKNAGHQKTYDIAELYALALQQKLTPSLESTKKEEKTWV